MVSHYAPMTSALTSLNTHGVGGGSGGGSSDLGKANTHLKDFIAAAAEHPQGGGRIAWVWRMGRLGWGDSIVNSFRGGLD